MVHFFQAKSLESFNRSKNSGRKWELKLPFPVHHHLCSASLCRPSSRAKMTEATSGEGEPGGKVSEIVDAPVSFLIECVSVFCFL